MSISFVELHLNKIKILRLLWDSLSPLSAAICFQVALSEAKDIVSEMNDGREVTILF